MKITMAILLSIGILTSCTSTEKKTTSYTGHGVESVSPEILQRFAPPRLNGDISAKIQSMLDIRSPSLGRLTPDGTKLFFSWNITGLTQVWRLDGPQKFPVQMTGGEDPTTMVGMTPDGKWLIHSRDRRGEENPGLYLQSASGGPLQAIQHLAKVRTGLQWVSDDGTYLYISANDIRPDSYTLYKYDLKTRKKEKIFDEPGIWSIADVHTNQKRLLLEKSTGNLSSEFFEYDLEAKKLLPLFGQGEKEEYSAAYGAREGEWIVATPKFGEFRRLYRWRNKKFEPITPEMKMEVQGFYIDFPRERIFYTVDEQAYTRLKVLDAKTFKPVALPNFSEADHVFTGGSTRNGRFSTFGIVTSKQPRTNYVFDWSTRKLTRWVIPSSPEIDTQRFATAQLESYTARDGTQIPMFVRRPPQCKTQVCPVIVYFHGGPEGQSVPGFSPFAQIFVDEGFIFVEPNVRGSFGYGKSWLHADNGPDRLKVITDIDDVSKHIRTKWSKNGTSPKIGVMGYSYGGYATLMGMTYFGGSFDAGVSLVGISNLITFLQNTAPYRRILRISEYGDPETDFEALKELSPITHLAKLKAPLMIIQGASDPRVPVGEAVQFYEAARAKRIAAELILFPDEGHGAQKRDNRALEIGHTLSFFKKHLN